MQTPEIFISYAWGDGNETGESREKIVNDFYEALVRDKYNIVRDKMDLGYGGLISEFMERIGQGDLIIVVMSKKYVKSPYCMFELYEIARNCRFEKAEFTKKVLPIVAEFIKFDDPDVLMEYFDYWAKEEQKWTNLIQKYMSSGQVTEAQSRRFHITQTIKQNFGKLADWLADINAGSNKLLSENDFALLKQTIQNRLTTQTTPNTVGNNPSTLTPLQTFKQECHDLIDELRYSELFEKIRSSGFIYTRPTLAQFGQQYSTGHVDFQFPDRLKTFVNGIKEK